MIQYDKLSLRIFIEKIFISYHKDAVCSINILEELKSSSNQISSLKLKLSKEFFISEFDKINERPTFLYCMIAMNCNA